MKSKQLANVLIKILGLSVVIHNVPVIVTAITSELFNFLQGRGFVAVRDVWLYPASAIILLVLGILLILQSRCITDWLFKDGEE